MSADWYGIRAKLAAADEKVSRERKVMQAGGGHAALVQAFREREHLAQIAEIRALLAELDAKDAALARVRELADEAERESADDLGTMSIRANMRQSYGMDYDEAESAWPALVSTASIRAALDGDGTPGPTNATDAPTVAKRTADGGSA